jgi:YVTN family beta-propeller protein
MKRYAWLAFAMAALAAAPGYKLLTKIKIGGLGRWDYVYVDSPARRLYVSHGGQTEAVDLDSEKLVGTIPNTTGVHGIAIASEFGRGFTSNGGSNNVTIFDLKTLQAISTVSTGMNPDAIVYEPVSKRVFTLNGRSKDSTAIDAKTGEVVAASIPVNGKPEFAQADGKGNIYFNNEDSSEVYAIDGKTATVTKHYSIAPCDSPSGLAIDTKKHRLFSVCENKLIVVSDPDAGKVLASLPIGPGADGVAFDDGYAFASSGGDGTITVVGESGGKYEVAETVQTQRGARTIGADPKTHKLYLPDAEMGPPPPDKDGKKQRPQPLPDSFAILVVGR